MRLYANENFPLAVVHALRSLGHDVVTAQDAGNAGRAVPDEDVLAYAVSEQRALVTPAGVVPRIVHPDAGEEYACFADGIYLAVRATGFEFSAQLTDIADGRVRMLSVPEPGVACSFPHYVSSTEVLLDCGMPGTPAIPLFYRIDPRTLAYVP